MIHKTHITKLSSLRRDGNGCYVVELDLPVGDKFVCASIRGANRAYLVLHFLAASGENNKDTVQHKVILVPEGSSISGAHNIICVTEGFLVAHVS